MTGSDQANQALQAVLQGGGQRPALFPPTSRYCDIETATIENAEGRITIYLRRRFLPSPKRFASPRRADACSFSICAGTMKNGCAASSAIAASASTTRN